MDGEEENRPPSVKRCQRTLRTDGVKLNEAPFLFFFFPLDPRLGVSFVVVDVENGTSPSRGRPEVVLPSSLGDLKEGFKWADPGPVSRTAPLPIQVLRVSIRTGPIRSFS